MKGDKSVSTDCEETQMSSCETCDFIRDAHCVFAENEHLIATIDELNQEIIIIKGHEELSQEKKRAIEKILQDRFSDAESIEFKEKDQHVFIYIHA